MANSIHSDGSISSSGSVVMVGGKMVTLPSGSRNIRISGGRVWVNGTELFAEGSPEGTLPPGNHIVELRIVGDPLDVTCDSTVTVTGNVMGNVQAGDAVQCGAVSGSVNAGDSVQCGNVAGNVNAGDSIRCGNIQGQAIAGDSIRRSR